MRFNNKKSVKYIIISIISLTIVIIAISVIAIQFQKNKKQELEKLAQINYLTKSVPQYAADIINYCSENVERDFFECVVSRFSNYSFEKI